MNDCALNPFSSRTCERGTECCDVRHEPVASALAILGLDADAIFERIREDLERGLVKEARSHLNFVDSLKTEKAKQ